jgi:hypothetical protein
MRNLIDTNVWIDGISGNLSKSAFLKLSVEAEWAGYSAITLITPGQIESPARRIDIFQQCFFLTVPFGGQKADFKGKIEPFFGKFNNYVK